METFNQLDIHFLIAAICVISSALVFYTIGVWGERLQKKLKAWHLIFFIAGLCSDRNCPDGTYSASYPFTRPCTYDNRTDRHYLNVHPCRLGGMDLFQRDSSSKSSFQQVQHFCMVYLAYPLLHRYIHRYVFTQISRYQRERTSNR